MPSSTMLKFYHNSEKSDTIKCKICNYSYRKDAPQSTLQKHLRVKHNFSIRKPLSDKEFKDAIISAKEPIFEYYTTPGRDKANLESNKNIFFEKKSPDTSEDNCLETNSPPNYVSPNPNISTTNNINSLLNPSESSTLPLSNELESSEDINITEEKLIAWLLKERISINSIYCPEFISFLNCIQPEVELPSYKRIQELLVNRLGKIINQKPTF